MARISDKARISNKASEDDKSQNGNKTRDNETRTHGAARRRMALATPKRLERSETRLRLRTGSRPGRGVLNLSRITKQDWRTLPLETLVERRILGLSLQQLELHSTNNIVHYVLNTEHNKDQLLTSNTLKCVLSKTPKFSPTPNIIKQTILARDCNLFGHSLIKTLNRFICKEYIDEAKINSKLTGIRPYNILT
jgi:hypothetical protein